MLEYLSTLKSVPLLKYDKTVINFDISSAYSSYTKLKMFFNLDLGQNLKSIFVNNEQVKKYLRFKIILITSLEEEEFYTDIKNIYSLYRQPDSESIKTIYPSEFNLIDNSSSRPVLSVEKDFFYFFNLSSFSNFITDGFKVLSYAYYDIDKICNDFSIDKQFLTSEGKFIFEALFHAESKQESVLRQSIYFTNIDLTANSPIFNKKPYLKLGGYFSKLYFSDSIVDNKNIKRMSFFFDEERSLKETLIFNGLSIPVRDMIKVEGIEIYRSKNKDLDGFGDLEEELICSTYKPSTSLAKLQKTTLTSGPYKNLNIIGINDFSIEDKKFGSYKYKVKVAIKDNSIKYVLSLFSKTRSVKKTFKELQTLALTPYKTYTEESGLFTSSFGYYDPKSGLISDKFYEDNKSKIDQLIKDFFNVLNIESSNIESLKALFKLPAGIECFTQSLIKFEDKLKNIFSLYSKNLYVSDFTEAPDSIGHFIIEHEFQEIVSPINKKQLGFDYHNVDGDSIVGLLTADTDQTKPLGRIQFNCFTAGIASKFLQKIYAPGKQLNVIDVFPIASATNNTAALDYFTNLDSYLEIYGNTKINTAEPFSSTGLDNINKKASYITDSLEKLGISVTLPKNIKIGDLVVSEKADGQDNNEYLQAINKYKVQYVVLGMLNQSKNTPYYQPQNNDAYIQQVHFFRRRNIYSNNILKYLDKDTLPYASIPIKSEGYLALSKLKLFFNTNKKIQKITFNIRNPSVQEKQQYEVEPFLLLTDSEISERESASSDDLYLCRMVDNFYENAGFISNPYINIPVFDEYFFGKITLEKYSESDLDKNTSLRYEIADTAIPNIPRPDTVDITQKIPSTPPIPSEPALPDSAKPAPIIRPIIPSVTADPVLPDDVGPVPIIRPIVPVGAAVPVLPDDAGTVPIITPSAPPVPVRPILPNTVGNVRDINPTIFVSTGSSTPIVMLPTKTGSLARKIILK